MGRTTTAAPRPATATTVRRVADLGAATDHRDRPRLPATAAMTETRGGAATPALGPAALGAVLPRVGPTALAPRPLAGRVLLGLPATAAMTEARGGRATPADGLATTTALRSRDGGLPLATAMPEAGCGGATAPTGGLATTLLGHGWTPLAADPTSDLPTTLPRDLDGRRAASATTLGRRGLHRHAGSPSPGWASACVSLQRGISARTAPKPADLGAATDNRACALLSTVDEQYRHTSPRAR